MNALASLPKVELHRHLELSFRHTTLRELALEAGMPLPDDEAFARQFLITSPMQDLACVLNKFLSVQKLLTNQQALERITYEAIADAANEGIKIFELRYSPTFIQGEQEEGSLSFEQIHQAICRGQERAEKDFAIATGLICIIQRTLSVAQAEEVANFAIAHKNTFVGLDLADNEVGFDSKPFAPLFQRARQEGLGITVHAGETRVEGAAYFVRDAIEHLGAQRIGHGLQIHDEPAMMNYVQERGVVLELCLTSNWLTGAVATLDQHPFRKLFNHGIKTTINSDDPGIFNIDLLNEYQLLTELHCFSTDELNSCNDYAAAASFIPLAKKQTVWPRLIN